MKSPDDLEKFLQARGIEVVFIALPDGARTVTEAARALGVAAERIVKSLLFMVDGKPVLVIASGTGRVDTSRLADHFKVRRSEIRLADSEDVLRVTGYEVGAVPPVGHDCTLHTLIDPAVLRFDPVYAGGGAHDHLLQISPAVILQENQAHVVELQSAT
jgi:prolyl-tRNA editing enzyme YbaK/EbsC (Cys-tRNA(Pro) deacylase)